MPSTYTHYRFGLDVLKNLDDEIKHLIERNMDLYLIGLHGPDILFYYKALSKNEVNKRGFEMHEENAMPFFNHARNVIRKSHNDEALIAYILGFMCHFSLDSECHGYIEAVIHQGELTHTEIETDYERKLLLLDGRNPKRYNTASHIEDSKENASAIAAFFDTVNQKQIYESLQSMKRYNQLLVPSNGIKCALLRLIMLVTCNYDAMHGLIMDGKKEEACKESSLILEQRYHGAIHVARMLIVDFYEKLDTRERLNIRFNRTFGPDRIELERYEKGGCQLEA